MLLSFLACLVLPISVLAAPSPHQGNVERVRRQGPDWVTATANALNQPSPPSSLKYAHLTDCWGTSSDNTIYPVLKYTPLGITFWALSWTDNRSAEVILGYNDTDNTIVQRLDLTGTRYLCTILWVNETRVAFVGQAGIAVTATISELLNGISP